MSRAEKNIIGLEHGKVGDRIAVVRDGKRQFPRMVSIAPGHALAIIYPRTWQHLPKP